MVKKIVTHAPTVICLRNQKSVGLPFFLYKTIFSLIILRWKKNFLAPNTTIAYDIKFQWDSSLMRCKRKNFTHRQANKSDERIRFVYEIPVNLSLSTQITKKTSQIIRRWHLKLYLYQLHGNETRNDWNDMKSASAHNFDDRKITRKTKFFFKTICW